MKLEGKTKEEFEKWYNEEHWYIFFQELIDQGLHDINFNGLPPSMQWGVYQDFFDSVGVHINIEYYNDGKGAKQDYTFEVMSYPSDKWYPDRQQARTAAIKAAMEIHNKTK